MEEGGGVGVGVGVEGGKKVRGGEKALRRFISLRVESSKEKAAIYIGEDVVSSFPPSSLALSRSLPLSLTLTLSLSLSLSLSSLSLSLSLSPTDL